MMVFGIDEQWAGDLIEVITIAESNRGYRSLLTVVDVFSKYVSVEPTKTKSGQDVTIAFEKILKRSQGRQPQKLETDDGKEFLQQTLPSFDETEKYPSFLYQWRHQSQHRRTIQSHLERKIVSIFYHQEQVDFLTRVAGCGLGLQSIIS